MTYVYVIKKEYTLADECVCLCGAYTNLDDAKNTAKNLAKHCPPGFCYEVHKVALDADNAGVSDELFSYDSEG